MQLRDSNLRSDTEAVPTGIVVTPDGEVFVANHGSAPAAADQLVQVVGHLPGLPGDLAALGWSWSR